MWRCIEDLLRRFRAIGRAGPQVPVAPERLVPVVPPMFARVGPMPAPDAPAIVSPVWAAEAGAPPFPASPTEVDPAAELDRSFQFFQTLLPWSAAAAVFMHCGQRRQSVRIPKETLDGLYAYVVIEHRLPGPEEGAPAPHLQRMIFRPVMGAHTEHGAVALRAAVRTDTPHHVIRCGGTLIFRTGVLEKWSLRSGSYHGIEPALAVTAEGRPGVTDYPLLPLPIDRYMTLRQAETAETRNSHQPQRATGRQLLEALLPGPQLGAAAPVGRPLRLEPRSGRPSPSTSSSRTRSVASAPGP